MLPLIAAGLGGLLGGYLTKDFIDSKKESISDGIAKGIAEKPFDVDIPVDVDIPTTIYSPQYSPQFSYTYQPILTFNSPGTTATAITKKSQRLQQTANNTATNQPTAKNEMPITSGLFNSETGKWLLIAGGIIAAAIVMKK